MKFSSFIFLVFISICLFSCEKEDDSLFYNVAVPVTQSIAEFRASAKVMEPREIKESGKIYSYGDYIFINDRNEGVHIIDNSDPYTPKKIKFIKIPQNTDIAIRDEKLYANSGMDLVVFDIGNIDQISETARIKDVFPTYYAGIPENASFIDFKNFNAQEQVVIGYVIERKKRPANSHGWDMVNPQAANGGGNGTGGRTGTGGSMSRFNIKEQFLYVVDQSNLSTFDISTPESPIHLQSDYAGWNIETIFNYEDHLYLGSATGMYIYSLEDPTKPKEVSFLQHVLGCDPVVVKGDYAYVTIRGGNECQQNFNQLDVVDISDKSSPFIANTYEMHNPYGLGVKDNWLFVCDGGAGLKVYDIQNTPDLRLIDQFSNITTFDVIPLEGKLLMVGDNILYQYSYKGNEINLISSFTLD